MKIRTVFCVQAFKFKITGQLCLSFLHSHFFTTPFSMEALAISAWEALGPSPEDRPRFTKVLIRLLDLLKQYPGGLTEAVIATELKKLEKQGNAKEQRLEHEIPQAGTPDSQCQVLPMHKQFQLQRLHTSSTQQGCPASEVHVHLVERISPGSGAVEGANSSSGVWVCYVRDVASSERRGGLAQLCMHTQQHILLQPGPDGKPWVQGKRLRVGRLIPMPSPPTLTTSSNDHGDGKLIRAAPTLALAPLLTPNQWQLRSHLLGCITPGAHVMHVNEAVAAAAHMRAGDTSVIQGWVCGHVHDVQHQPHAGQVVVMVQPALEADLQLPPIPVVFQGQQVTDLAGLLRPGELIAVHQPTLQAQAFDGTSTHPRAVLWFTSSGSRLVIGPHSSWSRPLAVKRPPSDPLVDTTNNHHMVSATSKKSRPSSADACATALPPEGGQEQADATQPGRDLVVWGWVQRVRGCVQQQQGAGVLQLTLTARWSHGPGQVSQASAGCEAGADAQAVAGAPAWRDVEAQLHISQAHQVVPNLRDGHLLLIIGGSLTHTDTTCRPGTPWLLKWSDGGGGTSPVSGTARPLLVNVSCLPALLTTPCLFLHSLCATQPAAAHHTACLPQQPRAPTVLHQNNTIGCAHVREIGLAQWHRGLPSVVCAKLLHIHVDTHRVHRCCGRPVKQSLDLALLNDMFSDDAEDQPGDVAQPPEPLKGPAALQQTTLTQGFLEAPAGHGEGDTHPGLWHCACCKKEVAGGDVVWSYQGHACLHLADHHSLQALRACPPWSISRTRHASETHGQVQPGRQCDALGPAVEHVMHEVGLEHNALLTLCGTSAQMWRSLSEADRAKRVPELAPIQEPCTQHVCTPTQGRTILACLAAPQRTNTPCAEAQGSHGLCDQAGCQHTSAAGQDHAGPTAASITQVSQLTC